ncbi:MAG: TonB family protein [Bacteroidales bacterium]|nr:TonB family protein [Bacteroidales bacterium]
MSGAGIRHFVDTIMLMAGIFIATAVTAQDMVPPEPLSEKWLIREFIEEEMVYPPEDLASKTEGEVALAFIVGINGSVSGIRVTQPVSPGLDSEAIRILRMILWKPGNVLGIPQAMEHTFSIKFAAGKYGKLCKKRGYDEISYPYQPVDTSGIVYDPAQADVSPRPVFSSLNCTLDQFVANQLKYPEAAFRQNISGTVEIKFVVEPGGRISNIHTLKSLGGGCTEEAIRLARMIKWKPGIKDEKAIRVFNTLKITFTMAGKSVDGSVATPGQVH